MLTSFIESSSCLKEGKFSKDSYLKLNVRTGFCNIDYCELIYSEGIFGRRFILKEKLDPLPASEYTKMSPFSFYIIILLMVSPNPIPPLLIFLDFSIVPKNLKSFSIYSFSIPMPVSSTVVIKYGSS